MSGALLAGGLGAVRLAGWPAVAVIRCLCAAVNAGCTSLGSSPLPVYDVFCLALASTRCALLPVRWQLACRFRRGLPRFSVFAFLSLALLEAGSRH